MPNLEMKLDYVRVTANSELPLSDFGRAAKHVQNIKNLSFPSPETVALPFNSVQLLSDNDWFDLDALIEEFKPQKIFSVLPSVIDASWGGPEEFHDVGLNNEVHAELANSFGQADADKRYVDYIITYSCNVARIDPEEFEDLKFEDNPVEAALGLYEKEIGEPFPQSPAEQLLAVLVHMVRTWESVSARLLRQSRGAPSDAGLGLLVQDHSWSCQGGFKGLGDAGNLNVVTGERQISGHFNLVDATAGNEACRIPIACPDGKRSLESEIPAAYSQIVDALEHCRRKFRDELRLDFAIVENELFIRKVFRPNMEAKANLSAAVSLANDGIISREDALLRVDPKSLAELLRAKVDPGQGRAPIFSGVPASPGGATGRLVFSSAAAVRLAANNIACILVRRETSPEDVRGLMAAKGIVTERGGATSHAAVIARGLGVPGSDRTTGSSAIGLEKRRKFQRKRRLVVSMI